MTILNLRYSLSISLVSGLFMLQGCSLNPNFLGEANATTSQSGSTAAQGAKTSQQKSAPSVELGNQLFKQGRKQAAADTYYRAALSLPSPQRERVILQAAEVTASLGDDKTTKQYLKKIPRQALVGENQTRYRYTLALLALQNEQANLALRLLPINASEMSDGLQNKIQLVRQRALEMGGRLPDEREVAQGIPLN